MIRRKKGWGHPLSMAVLAGLLAGPGALQAKTFALQRRTNETSASFSLPLGKAEVLFKKEPDYAGEKVVRSVLYVAPGQKEYIGFACDFESNKLYLDLNRNLDLTDDPDGVFESNGNDYGRTYSGISIPVEQAGRRREMVVDLQIWGDKWGRYTVQSSWEGDAVAIGKKTWRVSVVDDGDGVITAEDPLFLTPMADDFEADDGENRIELRAPFRLVLDGEPFDLSYELSADGSSLALAVAPGSGRLVDVDLRGEGIERLTMQDGETAGIFFGPGAAIRIPAGHYGASVCVRVGEGKQTSLWNAWNVPHQVREAGGDPWLVGGPLVSKLTCKAAGDRLRFDQAATGAGGEKYSLASSSGKSLGKPKLRVKKGGEVIHVGEFEYG